MRRIGCLVLALVIALGLGAGLAWVVPDQHDATEASVIEPALQHELSLANAQGLSILEEELTEERVLTRSVPLAAGSCIAWIVGTVGPDSLLSATLTLDGQPPISTTEYRSTVVHRATCTVVPTTALVRFELGREAARYGPTTTHYAILTGPIPPDPSSYDRLTADERLRASLDEGSLRARVRANSPGGTELLLLVATPDSGLLLPVSRATYAARRALSAGPHEVSEATLPPGAPPDPFAGPSDEHGAPRAHGSEGEGRMLAVLDAGALGADCIRVLLARRDDPRVAVPITAVRLPELTEERLPTTDPAIATHTICPASGLYVYVTPQGPGGDVEVHVHAIAAPTGAARSPSTFETTRLVLPEVTRLSARCTAGEDAACVELAGFAAAGAEGAGDAVTLLTPVCNRGGGEPCALLADVLSRSPEARARARAGDFERRACATGHLSTCAVRAAAFRERGALLEAYQTYRFGCDRGEPAACTALGLFTEWQLLPSVPPPVTPETLP